MAVSCRVLGLTVTTLAAVPRFDELAITFPPWVVMFSTRPAAIWPDTGTQDIRQVRESKVQQEFLIEIWTAEEEGQIVFRPSVQCGCPALRYGWLCYSAPFSYKKKNICPWGDHCFMGQPLFRLHLPSSILWLSRATGLLNCPLLISEISYSN